MSGSYRDVRIVPHGKGGAVKLSGGRGNKPIKITDDLALAKAVAEQAATRFEVPILTFDAAGTLLSTKAWTARKRNQRKHPLPPQD
ncbi:MAG: hypothetical protein HONBIEJF_00966 [Fimbriimonadaceae bacterium]|nr:hypothetical protein [Fimbriimonadaceae bacterium]